VLKDMAGTTGLEPAASAVTGQRSNQLNYVPKYIYLQQLTRLSQNELPLGCCQYSLFIPSCQHNHPNLTITKQEIDRKTHSPRPNKSISTF
jgi:hypothetical protein